jgi:predicted NACHT family NTPase
MADESRGSKANFRRAEIYLDEQNRRRIDRDGSHKDDALNSQTLTREMAQKMIEEAFAKLRISGDGVTGSKQQWAINRVC